MTLEDFVKYISYNPSTGEFKRVRVFNDNPGHTWRIGEVIGNETSNGYLEIAVGQYKYPAHRLAWYLTQGEYPSCSIDHINGNKQDNRIENLRLATSLDNIEKAVAARKSANDQFAFDEDHGERESWTTKPK